MLVGISQDRRSAAPGVGNNLSDALVGMAVFSAWMEVDSTQILDALAHMRAYEAFRGEQHLQSHCRTLQHTVQAKQNLTLSLGVPQQQQQEAPLQCCGCCLSASHEQGGCSTIMICRKKTCIAFIRDI